jgi:hypothetical protein
VQHPRKAAVRGRVRAVVNATTGYLDGEGDTLFGPCAAQWWQSVAIASTSLAIRSIFVAVGWGVAEGSGISKRIMWTAIPRARFSVGRVTGCVPVIGTSRIGRSNVSWIDACFGVGNRTIARIAARIGVGASVKRRLISRAACSS